METKIIRKKIKLIDVDKTPKGRFLLCKSCYGYIKSEEYYIRLEKGKINKTTFHNVCIECYLSAVGSKIGWDNLNKIILKLIERGI